MKARYQVKCMASWFGEVPRLTALTAAMLSRRTLMVLPPQSFPQFTAAMTIGTSSLAENDSLCRNRTTLKHEPVRTGEGPTAPGPGGVRREGG